MISVMIPTRKRVKSLDRVLHSIWDMSSSEDTVEVLLRCDEDDEETIMYLDGINRENHPNIQVLVGPRKDGYKSLPSFFNEMTAVTHGNLLMCCNDDVIFRTRNWDRIVEGVAAHYQDGIFNIGVNSILNPQFFVFTIVSRRWVDIVGYIQDPRLLWQGKFLKDVSDALGRSIYVPEVIVEHDWAGFSGDATRAEAANWEREIVLADSSSDRWRDDYKRLHDEVVVEVVEKLKAHLDPSIKPIFAGSAITNIKSIYTTRVTCVRVDKIKPTIKVEYLHIVQNMGNKPRLLIGWIIDIPIRNGARFLMKKLLNLTKLRLL